MALKFITWYRLGYVTESELSEMVREKTGRGQGKSITSDRFSRNNVTKQESADL